MSQFPSKPIESQPNRIESNQLHTCTWNMVFLCSQLLQKAECTRSHQLPFHFYFGIKCTFSTIYYICCIIWQSFTTHKSGAANHKERGSLHSSRMFMVTIVDGTLYDREKRTVLQTVPLLMHGESEIHFHMQCKRGTKTQNEKSSNIHIIKYSILKTDINSRKIA